MKHRIGGLQNTYMGLGADNIPYELDNTFSGNEKLDKVAHEMFEVALETICKKNDIDAFDFKVISDNKSFDIKFGYEPAYMHDPYFMICITSFYKDSYIAKGVAKGYYGKDIEITYHKTAVDEDRDKDFGEFLDEWYPKLLECFE
jgi:hypothetical protein